MTRYRLRANVGRRSWGRNGEMRRPGSTTSASCSWPTLASKRLTARGDNRPPGARDPTVVELRNRAGAGSPWSPAR